MCVWAPGRLPQILQTRVSPPRPLFPLCMGIPRPPHHSLRRKVVALAGVAQWIECRAANQRVSSSIPSQGTWLACGPGPQLFSLLSSLSKNKICKKEKWSADTSPTGSSQGVYQGDHCPRSREHLQGKEEHPHPLRVSKHLGQFYGNWKSRRG